LDQKESNKKDTSQSKSEFKDNLTNNNIAKTRRIRNLKKFQVIIFKRAIILLVNLTIHGNEKIKKPKSLTKAQSLL
jgi:hypothetical protein